MPIIINCKPTSEDLTGRSHWWGFADLPKGVEYPALIEEDGFEDPMTFICQIRLEEIAQHDPEGLLPHKGMLWFFASLDYFLGNIDAECEGIGEWDKRNFRVLYSEDELEDFVTHPIYYEDGEPAALPAEELEFQRVKGEQGPGEQLLGMPFFDEVREQMKGCISLLQIDEKDEWGLRFFDCGMLNFMISKKDLKARRFDKVRLYMHCL